MKLKFRKGEGEIISAIARRVLDVYVGWFDKKKKRYCSKQLEEELAGLFPGVSVKKQIRKYYLKQSDVEIAKSLKCKPSSVRMMLTRARRDAVVLLEKENFKYEII